MCPIPHALSCHRYDKAAAEAAASVARVERTISTCRALAPPTSVWRKTLPSHSASQMVTAVVDSFATSTRMFGRSDNPRIDRWKRGARAAVLQRKADLVYLRGARDGGKGGPPKQTRMFEALVDPGGRVRVKDRNKAKQ